MLAAHLMFDDFLKIGYGLGIATRMDIIVGISVIPFFYGTPVKRVALHLRNHVLSVIEPVLLDIAFG